MHKKLMVIVPDRISDFLNKGEVTERYYNPGDLFEEVHVVLTNDDRPDPAILQKTVGRARLSVYNLPGGKGLFLRTLGWRPWLLKGWGARAVALAREIRPQLIRCHGPWLNAYAASLIKKTLGIPYVVSLHINPDEDVRRRARRFQHRLAAYAQQDIEAIGLLDADLVMPVYRPILPYLERLGVERYEVCYNVLNPAHLRAKTDYRLHEPARIVCVGRQFAEKNPDNLIRAVSELPNVHLTIVGDGSHHDYLRQVAADCGAADRVTFVRAMPNDELCEKLPDYDIFAVHTEYWELSKSVLEPLLTGLPVVINRRLGEPVPELTDDICVLVRNTVQDYKQAIVALISDAAHREQLGQAAYRHAQANWSPARTEARFVEIYRRLALAQ